MASKKERFEILLEEIRDKVQAVAEGHEIVRSDIWHVEERLKEEFSAKIDAVHSSLKSEMASTGKMLNYEIKELDRKLEEHAHQPHPV